MDRPPLDVDALRATLGPRWARVEVVAETESTNADLLARREATDRTLLVAEHQRSGRGRFDRTWTSPPRAGLTFSVLLRPGVPLARWGWLPLLTGLAVVEGVRAATGLEAALKWPNDVLLDGAKLCGILAQTRDDAVVIGVGCNVSTSRDELPVPTATSLAVAGATVDRAELLVAVAGRLDARVAQWSDCGGDAAACGLAAAYRDVCDTVGRAVRVTLTDPGGGDGEGTVASGTVRAVDDDGHLVLVDGDGGDGASRTITAGDVEHLRAAEG
ncbi:BirA family transcriptional regulator, biotin operon repressor / biotin-[acetyl-CoA-carboxylase] ligase [Jatrophihabitans endophyticus]|uniref:BirA family transcriptional regulator, biotin operon repressor / biotin-[acetyl-CoA-carboxylase] ligase n=1 Tax=Jatrophihabitans endophyticus TaxID=1206085 RepID=A0A1M5UEZ3_9ACTN|nr:biotin--[acetyl-CoA-carboxylase] ligase [Jatrophihabitans endophyticus]SHH61468.1 BirA family transcriptional regulator, biotin operon repressor / biotin-[acetyl-CoA-carboxylase] ligase [Jatrophihabitans endophyticus]